MLKFKLLIFYLFLHGTAAVVLIDSDRNRMQFVGSSNQFSANSNEGCSLPESLINEIKSYQSTVDKIVAAVVNGKYSGSTWQRYYFSYENI